LFGLYSLRKRELDTTEIELIAIAIAAYLGSILKLLMG